MRQRENLPAAGGSHGPRKGRPFSKSPPAAGKCPRRASLSETRWQPPSPEPRARQRGRLARVPGQQPSATPPRGQPRAQRSSQGARLAKGSKAPRCLLRWTDGPGGCGSGEGCDWLGRRQATSLEEATRESSESGGTCWAALEAGALRGACCPPPRASSPLTTPRVCPVALSSLQGVHLFSLLISSH